MRFHRALILALALVALAAAPAAAEVFKIKLTNQTEFVTRYQPLQDPRNEDKVNLLTEFGNWISLPKSAVTEIEAEVEARGFGTVLDTATILIGWAPNDKPVPTDEPVDPTTRLLNYLQGRDAADQQDFSVDQFVTTESAGAGGLPASGVTSSGSSSFPVGSGGVDAAEPAVIDQ